MSKDSSKLRRLCNTLGQHIPATEPHLGILPNSQNKLAVRINLMNLLIVKSKWQIHCGRESRVQQQIKVWRIHVWSDHFILLNGLVENIIHEMGEYFLILI